MAYNHRSAEKTWVKWKEQEEKQLRELDVDEDTIQRLHTYDWQQFKADRNFYEKLSENSQVIEWTPQMNDRELENADNLQYRSVTIIFCWLTRSIACREYDRC